MSFRTKRALVSYCDILQRRRQKQQHTPRPSWKEPVGSTNAGGAVDRARATLDSSSVLLARRAKTEVSCFD